MDFPFPQIVDLGGFDPLATQVVEIVLLILLIAGILSFSIGSVFYSFDLNRYKSKRMIYRGTFLSGLSLFLKSLFLGGDISLSPLF